MKTVVIYTNMSYTSLIPEQIRELGIEVRIEPAEGDWSGDAFAYECSEELEGDAQLHRIVTGLVDDFHLHCLYVSKKL